ncbi:MAG: DUF1214 domain-containing protein [Bacteroidia bacterium]|nr:MAG: DUF1214 domain-containing protein [Bacteroidia bacterium]
MRKILYHFLRIQGAIQKFFLKIRGKTLQDFHDQRVVSGKAWSEFCDHLKAAGNVLLSPGAPRDPFQQAEGVRYLSRLTRAGLEAYLEYQDPLHPQLRRMVHETVKMGADNPDNYYQNAQISGNYTYKIVGKRNTVDHISFHTQNGNYGSTGGLAPCGKLVDRELVLEEDGSFEIVVSKEKTGKNWLKMEEETTLLMVRQTFADRKKEVPAELKVINTLVDQKPGSLTCSQLDEGLKTASMFVGGASLLFARWAHGFKKHVNQLPLFDPETSNAAGGDESIIYYHSYWKLEPDEALVIEVQPPDCDAWNFQLDNYWMESLDYRYYNICINKHEASYATDGSVRVIVSQEDPGLPNWIETAHHSEGTMCWRWYRLNDSAQAIQPSCRVMKRTELSHL